jgi:hypothetical protein
MSDSSEPDDQENKYAGWLPFTPEEFLSTFGEPLEGQFPDAPDGATYRAKEWPPDPEDEYAIGIAIVEEVLITLGLPGQRDPSWMRVGLKF